MKLVLINYEKVNVNVDMWVFASWQTFLKQHNLFETSIMTEKMIGCMQSTKRNNLLCFKCIISFWTFCYTTACITSYHKKHEQSLLASNQVSQVGWFEW
jgi:hypothetical protein